MDKIDNNVDMIVFGAGPAGLAAASLGLYQGRNVIVIEAGKHCAGRNSAGRGSAAGRGSGQGVSSRIVALLREITPVSSGRSPDSSVLARSRTPEMQQCEN